MSEFLRLFLATLLGAGVSFGTTLYFQRRKEILDQRRAEEADERELRKGLRLVRDELIDNETTISIARQAQMWWALPPYDLPVELWEEWRSSLADLLEEQRAWGYLSTAFSEVNRLNQKLAMFRAGREYPNETASNPEGTKVYNDAWAEGHDGEISPQWDDVLMRAQTILEMADREIFPFLFPEKDPPEVGNPPSRLEVQSSQEE
jgi:hypothetical protein